MRRYWVDDELAKEAKKAKGLKKVLDHIKNDRRKLMDYIRFKLIKWLSGSTIVMVNVRFYGTVICDRQVYAENCEFNGQTNKEQA